jgi:phosphoribosylformimino-5-aminoimidazole carboxamide ribotide isomerase
MDLYPAVDLRDGRCVRLTQGDFDRQVTYDADPVDVVRQFAAAGAPWIHVVDLDAARTGVPHNRAVVAAIATAVDVPVQAGGGVRSEDAAEALFEAGVARVVVGTAAIEDPGFVDRLAAGGRRIAVGIDVRGTDVATHGWEQSSGQSIEAVLDRFASIRVDAFVVTQIRRDGMLAGPDLEGLAAVLARTAVPVIASGGVGGLDDLRSLAALEVGDRRLAGAIVGKAIHDGRFDVAAALEVLA